jgi:ABC-type uncharacterized transport system ATPase subunit
MIVNSSLASHQAADPGPLSAKPATTSLGNLHEGADISELVVLTEVSKSYGGATALDSVSLRVRHASIHAILGENGAGKSTLIKVLTGVVKPDMGTAVVNGSQLTLGSA